MRTNTEREWEKNLDKACVCLILLSLLAGSKNLAISLVRKTRTNLSHHLRENFAGDVDRHRSFTVNKINVLCFNKNLQTFCPRNVEGKLIRGKNPKNNQCTLLWVSSLELTLCLLLNKGACQHRSRARAVIRDLTPFYTHIEDRSSHVYGLTNWIGALSAVLSKLRTKNPNFCNANLFWHPFWRSKRGVLTVCSKRKFVATEAELWLW